MDKNTGTDGRGLRRVVIAGVAGNILEWYDFALYGYLATIIAGQFFPSGDSLAALINTYAVFAVGFLARPLGGVVYGVIGDRFGRRHLLIISVVMILLVGLALLRFVPRRNQ